MAGEFSVCSYFHDGSYEYELRGVDASTAINCAHRIAGSVGGRIGLVARIIITDAGDCINWEWQFGKGVVYPTKEDLKRYEQEAPTTGRPG